MPFFIFEFLRQFDKILPMGSNKVTINSIVEDTTWRHGLWATHGISFLIESGRQKILFDTSESAEILLHNLKVLKIDLGQINCLVISHGHIDHMGGLVDTLPHFSNQPVYLLEKALDEYRDSYGYEYANLPLFRTRYKPETARPKILSYKNLKFVKEPIQIQPNFWLTGPLINKQGVNEQALVMTLSEGLMIMTGCSHPGIKRIIKKAQEITGREKIYALVGGLHLKEASKKGINNVIDYLKRQQPEVLAPCHCTGLEVTQMMKKSFREKVKISILGSFSPGDKISLL